MTTITCAHCGEEAEKPLKEIRRRKKLGKTEFYCNAKTPKESLVKWINSDENKSNLKEYSEKYNNSRIDEYTIIRGHLRIVNSRVATGRYKSTDLDLPYLLEIWNKQDGRCAYTGVKLINPKSGAKGNKELNKNYQSSLDRIDNTIGYIKGNVQFVSVSVNWLKNNQSDDSLYEFFKIVQNINILTDTVS